MALSMLQFRIRRYLFGGASSIVQCPRTESCGVHCCSTDPVDLVGLCTRMSFRRGIMLMTGTCAVGPNKHIYVHMTLYPVNSVGIKDLFVIPGS